MGCRQSCANAREIRLGPLLPLFRPFDRVPLREHGIGRVGFATAINMRMTTNELLRDLVGDGIEIEGLGLRGDLGMHHDLEEHVAKFLF